MKMRRNAKNTSKASFRAAREEDKRLDHKASARVEECKAEGKIPGAGSMFMY